MTININNNDNYVVVYFSGEGFNDDITLSSVDEFYNDIDNGLYQHSMYVACGFKTKDKATEYFNEIWEDKHYEEN